MAMYFISSIIWRVNTPAFLLYWHFTVSTCQLRNENPNLPAGVRASFLISLDNKCLEMDKTHRHISHELYEHTHSLSISLSPSLDRSRADRILGIPSHSTWQIGAVKLVHSEVCGKRHFSSGLEEDSSRDTMQVSNPSPLFTKTVFSDWPFLPLLHYAPPVESTSDCI